MGFVNTTMSLECLYETHTTAERAGCRQMCRNKSVASHPQFVASERKLKAEALRLFDQQLSDFILILGLQLTLLYLI